MFFLTLVLRVLLLLADVQHLCHPLPIFNGPCVLSASGDVMSSALCGILPLSQHLSTTAQSAFVLHNLRTGMLVSLAQIDKHHRSDI
jgi:hypothetical protein